MFDKQINLQLLMFIVLQLTVEMRIKCYDAFLFGWVEVRHQQGTGQNWTVYT